MVTKAETYLLLMTFEIYLSRYLERINLSFKKLPLSHFPNTLIVLQKKVEELKRLTILLLFPCNSAIFKNMLYKVTNCHNSILLKNHLQCSLGNLEYFINDKNNWIQ